MATTSKNKVAKIKKVTPKEIITWLDWNNSPVNLADMQKVIENAEEKEEEVYLQKSNYKRNTVDLCFSPTRLPHCCGIVELGDLTINKRITQSDFNDIMGAIHAIKGKTFIINTNGISNSVIWESLLVKCPYFTMVKSFVNSNSENTIKMWISNN